MTNLDSEKELIEDLLESYGDGNVRLMNVYVEVCREIREKKGERWDWEMLYNQ